MANSAMRELVIRNSAEQVFAVALTVLSEAEAISIVDADEAGREIAADVDRSNKSFGERLDVSVESLAQGETRLLLRSKSSFWATMWDWGKNRQNVEWLAQAVEAQLQS